MEAFAERVRDMVAGQNGWAEAELAGSPPKVDPKEALESDLQVERYEDLERQFAAITEKFRQKNIETGTMPSWGDFSQSLTPRVMETIMQGFKDPVLVAIPPIRRKALLAAATAAMEKKSWLEDLDDANLWNDGKPKTEEGWGFAVIERYREDVLSVIDGIRSDDEKEVSDYNDTIKDCANASQFMRSPQHFMKIKIEDLPQQVKTILEALRGKGLDVVRDTNTFLAACILNPEIIYNERVILNGKKIAENDAKVVAYGRLSKNGIKMGVKEGDKMELEGKDDTDKLTLWPALYLEMPNP